MNPRMRGLMTAVGMLDSWGAGRNVYRSSIQGQCPAGLQDRR